MYKCEKQQLYGKIRFIRSLRKRTHTKQRDFFFSVDYFDFFFIFAQNTEIGYMLESLRSGSNKYPQSMFWIKNKKQCISLYTPVLQYKSGVRGYTDILSFSLFLTLCYVTEIVGVK